MRWPRCRGARHEAAWPERGDALTETTRSAQVNDQWIPPIEQRHWFDPSWHAARLASADRAVEEVREERSATAHPSHDDCLSVRECFSNRSSCCARPPTRQLLKPLSRQVAAISRHVDPPPGRLQTIPRQAAPPFGAAPPASTRAESRCSLLFASQD